MLISGALVIFFLHVPVFCCNFASDFDREKQAWNFVKFIVSLKTIILLL